MINIRIFTQLIKELRIKLDITKADLAAEKTMRTINFGLNKGTMGDAEYKAKR